MLFFFLRWGLKTEEESGEEETPTLNPLHPNKTSPTQTLPTLSGRQWKWGGGRGGGGGLSGTSSFWGKQSPLCSFLIYEVLLLKIPSANRQFL